MAQLVGYLASVLLAISLLVNNDLKFRWLNTFGCLSFTIYGILIGAFPIILTNTILLLINVFYLVKIYRTEENFDLLEFSTGDKIVLKFLDFYKADIAAYFPEYKHDADPVDLRFVVLRDMVIANIFVASVSPEGNALVKINYTVAKYRDYKVGKFIFEKERKYLMSKGVKAIYYDHVFNKQHAHFLQKMGFMEEVVHGKKQYVKRLV